MSSSIAAEIDMKSSLWYQPLMMASRIDPTLSSLESSNLSLLGLMHILVMSLIFLPREPWPAEPKDSLNV